MEVSPAMERNSFEKLLALHTQQAHTPGSL